VTVIVTALPAVATEEVAALVVLLLVARAVEEVETADEEVDAVLPRAVLPGAAVVLFANEVVDPAVTDVVFAAFDDELLDELPEVEEAAGTATVFVNGGLVAPQAMFRKTGSDVA